MATSARMTKYEAPYGFVYDWVKPHYHTELDENGTKHEVQEHLYAKYLFLSKYDTIDAYELVPDPKGVK